MSAAIGLVVVAFVAVTERLSRVLLHAGAGQRLLVPVAGSLVAGWLLYRYFPDARGSGIPQTRVALILRDGVISVRTVAGKFLCSAISLGSGIALGREGPSVQIAAGIASAAGRRLGLGTEHIRSLIPVATAAAIAAAFNTPLAAVLFTLEEILADLHARVVGSIVIGAATSWIVLRLILGDEPLFHVPAYQLVHPAEFLIYALLGLLGGLVSTAFVKLLLWQRARFLLTPTRWRPFAPATGGLLVGLLGLAVPGVLGVGYDLVGDALNGQLALRMMLVLLVLKVLATATCYSSGNAGGIFGPSLFIGAMLGGAVGQGAHLLFPDHTGNGGAYALVGMGAAFAGIIRTPMTSVIMIFEVTRDYTIIVPLMIANLCSYALAQRLQKRPIYEALTLQEGIIMPSPSHLPPPLTVEQAMRPQPDGTGPGALSPVHVHPDHALDTALQRMGEAGVDSITVLSRAGSRPLGTLSLNDAMEAYRNLGRTPPPDKPVPRQNWLPAVAAIVVAAVMITSGIVLWTRFRRHDQALEAFRNGQQLAEAGRLDDAVFALRNAVAYTPEDVKARAALGLTLVRAGRFREAEPYLAEAARRDPTSGPIWYGLAVVARSEGDKRRASELFKAALAKEWPPTQDAALTTAQLEYARVLADEGRRSEAVSTMLAMIEQLAGDPAASKRAAAMVKEFGTPDQVERAYTALAGHFPGDVGVWLSLGDARFAEHNDASALDAYRKALAADLQSPEARAGVARVEETLRLDPARRGLSERERARRWELVLERVVASLSACGATTGLENVRPLLNTRSQNSSVADQRTEAAVRLWQEAPAGCKADAVLSHVMASRTVVDVVEPALRK